MAVAGASLYRSQAIAQLKGVVTYNVPNLFGSAGGVSALSVLDAGRQFNAIPGIGLSANARALNSDFIASRAADVNKMFSLTAGTDGTVEGNIQAIAAIRASLPFNAFSREIRGEVLDQLV